MRNTVLHYLEETVLNYPDKTAITDERGSLTFSELRGHALSVAAAICRRLKGSKHKPVFVYLPKGKECIAAFMGIVYSGNIYTPADIKFPFPKTQKILDILKPALYISDKKNAQKLSENGISSDAILIYEDISDTKTDFDVSAALCRMIDTDPVYTLFTSGSTGVPKGVTITHRNIMDYIDWVTPICGISSTTIMGNQSPFYFDISTQDIYSTLKAAATLIIIPEHFFAFPVQVLSFIKEREINYLYWVPSAFVNVCSRDSLESVDISCVRQIIFGGEVMPVKHLIKWQNNIPGLKAMNVYGPTETTVNITYFPIERTFAEDELIPLGYPCGNTEILLLDDNDQLITAINVKGELCARGMCLSPGYWDNPEKTAEVFVQNPLNPHYPEKIYRTGDLAYYNERHELVFAGRKDFQIKHLGHRIELGEIETAAMSIEGVHMVCADYDSNNQRIVLLYSGVEDMTEKELKRKLMALIPKYMVPSKYFKLDSFPHNDNGKIDRVLLKKEYVG